VLDEPRCFLILVKNSPIVVKNTHGREAVFQVQS